MLANVPKTDKMGGRTGEMGENRNISYTPYREIPNTFPLELCSYREKVNQSPIILVSFQCTLFSKPYHLSSQPPIYLSSLESV